MIQREYRNGGLVLILDRPAQRNALNTEMYEQLRVGLQEANDDPLCHSVIITGAGGHFTAGNDLKDFQQPRPQGDSPALAFLRTLAHIDVPVIAAVEGHAVGVGVTLLQHCDFIYADETAMFSMPFVTLGLCPEGGASLLLERQVGRRKASQWLLLGERFSAAEAAEAGFITAVSAKGNARQDADTAAIALMQKPVEALRLTKRMLREPARAELDTAFDVERDRFHERLNSPEAQEAFRKFFERTQQ